MKLNEILKITETFPFLNVCLVLSSMVSVTFSSVLDLIFCLICFTNVLFFGPILRFELMEALVPNYACTTTKKNICLCVYVCIYIYVYIYIYMWVCVCVCVCVWVCIYYSNNFVLIAQ